jgi:ubiquitin C-terminal hydrolase
MQQLKNLKILEIHAAVLGIFFLKISQSLTKLQIETSVVMSSSLIIVRKPKGLDNIENTCYVISILQSLSYLQSFTSLFDTVTDLLIGELQTLNSQKQLRILSLNNTNFNIICPGFID